MPPNSISKNTSMTGVVKHCVEAGKRRSVAANLIFLPDFNCSLAELSVELMATANVTSASPPASTETNANALIDSFSEYTAHIIGQHFHRIGQLLESVHDQSTQPVQLFNTQLLEVHNDFLKQAIDDLQQQKKTSPPCCKEAASA